MLEQERITLSIEEAAALLGISRALAYELVRRGDLPRLRLGRRVVIPKKALEEFVVAATGPNAWAKADHGTLVVRGYR